MNKHLTILALVLLAALSAMASTSVTGDALTLNSSVTQFSTTAGFVQSITFRVIPGYCGKVYVGESTMNTSTYAATYAVLWPNCGGGLSDEYTIADPTGLNSIDTSKLYLAGQISGEKVLWSTTKTGCTASGCPVATLKLTPVKSGPVLNASSTQGSLLDPSGNSAAFITVRTVPGHVGKVRIGGTSLSSGLVTQPDAAFGQVHKALYPLSPSLMNKVDSLVLSDADNDMRPGVLASFAEVNGEFPLVAIFHRQ
jgi:hypothetical protein